MSSRPSSTDGLFRTIGQIQAEVAALRRGQIPRLRLPTRLETVDQDCVVDLDARGRLIGCGLGGVESAAEPIPTQRVLANVPPWHFTDNESGTEIAVATSDPWPTIQHISVAGLLISGGAGTSTSSFEIAASTAEVRVGELPAAGGVVLVVFQEFQVEPRSTLTISCTDAGGHTGVVVQPVAYVLA